MKLKNLLLAVGIVVVGFWLLGLILKIAVWILQVLIAVAAVLIVAGLLGRYFDERKRRR